MYWRRFAGANVQNAKLVLDRATGTYMRCERGLTFVVRVQIPPVNFTPAHTPVSTTQSARRARIQIKVRPHAPKRSHGSERLVIVS